MPGDIPPMHLKGNLTADPILRYTQGGKPVINFTVASTPRIQDRASNTWKDGEPTFMDVEAWGDLAEHAASTLKKGTRVMVDGILKTKTWKNKDDEPRRKLVVVADDIGTSLLNATAQITRTSGKGGSNAGQQQGSATPQGGQSFDEQPPEEPWFEGANAGGGEPWGNAPASAPAGGLDNPWANMGR